MRLIFMISLIFISYLDAYYKNDFYVGIDLSKGSGTTKFSVTNGNSSKRHYDMTSLTMKFGLIFDEDRLQFSYDVIDAKDGGYIERFSGLNVDYISVYKSDDISLFWTIGLGSYSYKDSATFVVGSDDVKGLSYNYGLGFMYDISKNFDFEIAFRSKILNWQDLYQVGNHNIKYSNRFTSNAIYYGLNYKF